MNNRFAIKRKTVEILAWTRLFLLHLLTVVSVGGLRHWVLSGSLLGICLGSAWGIFGGTDTVKALCVGCILGVVLMFVLWDTCLDRVIDYWREYWSYEESRSAVDVGRVLFHHELSVGHELSRDEVRDILFEQGGSELGDSEFSEWLNQCYGKLEEARKDSVSRRG